MVTRLQVTYKSPEIDIEFDKEITKFFESIGFRRWASGYDLLSFERDIAFERTEEVVGDESKRSTKIKLTA